MRGNNHSDETTYFPRGVLRTGYILKAHEVPMATRFRKRWKWIFSLSFASIAIVGLFFEEVSGSTGVAVILIFGFLFALGVLMYYRQQVEQTFRNCDPIPPKYGSGNYLNFVMDRGISLPRMRVMRFWVSGLILLALSSLAWLSNDGNQLMIYAVAGAGIGFSIMFLLYVVFLTCVRSFRNWR